MKKDRFGFEWKKYNSIKPEYKEQYKDQFLNWTHPLTPDFYKDKIILDAGCGMGRNSYWCLKWGAKELTACDHDERSVEAARETLKDFNNAHVVEADLQNLLWLDKFDFIFSIGVIHHTHNDKFSVKELYKALKPGGEILLWVYSNVGFENILKILNPTRKYFTSKLPPPVLHVTTYFITVPFYIYLKIFRQKREYFKQLKTFSFFHMHSILFDQFLPPIARYYTKDEAHSLLVSNNFHNIKIYPPPNKNGWIVRGIK